MGMGSLGGIPFRTGPEEIRWDFKMKISDKKALGGKVVQVLGTSLGDMEVTGSFGRGNRKRGDEAGWEEQLRFREQVDAWATIQETSRRPPTIRFVYPPRNWDFEVFVKRYTAPTGGPAVRHANDEINPKWHLTLFVLDEKSRKVIKGIRDLYIKRLMEGVGWKQTDFNGPSETQVAELLNGRTEGEYLTDLAQQAFDQGNLPTAGEG